MIQSSLSLNNLPPGLLPCRKEFSGVLQCIVVERHKHYNTPTSRIFRLSLDLTVLIVVTVNLFTFNCNATLYSVRTLIKEQIRIARQRKNTLTQLILHNKQKYLAFKTCLILGTVLYCTYCGCDHLSRNTCIAGWLRQMLDILHILIYFHHDKSNLTDAPLSLQFNVVNRPRPNDFRQIVMKRAGRWGVGVKNHNSQVCCNRSYFS